MSIRNDLLESLDEYFESLVTNGKLDLTRLKVDSQQTSFEQNYQFKYFDQIDDVAYGNQIVYKITLTNPINLFLRKLSIYSGGRSYRVYHESGVTFTGTLSDSGLISPMNQNINKQITEHPTTGVVIQRAIGSSILTPLVNPLDGLDALTDGNANRASSEFDAEGERMGYSGSQVVYAVLDHIGANNNASGFLKLAWEERFGE